MSILLNGECLEELKDLDDKSIDLIFCDLPYAVDNYSAVSCKWNTPIDLDKLWIEFMRIKKLNTPIVMTCTTKFGVSLINSAPKKCPFRYDLIWCKSAPAGFLCAKKMPMRKHEMVYVFYEKLPFYDLSSHKHKFIKEGNVGKVIKNNSSGTNTYNTENRKTPLIRVESKYSPALPTSLIKEEIVDKDIYKNEHETAYGKNIHHHNKEQKNGESIYEPPLPTSLIKEDYDTCDKPERKTIYGNMEIYEPKRRGEPRYDPPLPTSLIKEEIVDKVETKTVYKPSFTQKENADNLYQKCGRKNGESAYEPALPTSLIKEVIVDKEEVSDIYGFDNRTDDRPSNVRTTAYEPALPTSLIKEDKHTLYGEIKEKGIPHTTTYDPALPTSLLEIKSTRGKHSTEKPVQLMEWILKYYSKEGDTILDPTMGSGSMGVACKNMNRNFIGIEKDPEIYEGAINRVEN